VQGFDCTPKTIKIWYFAYKLASKGYFGSFYQFFVELIEPQVHSCMKNFTVIGGEIWIYGN